jgi:hypothetical protein
MIPLHFYSNFILLLARGFNENNGQLEYGITIKGIRDDGFKCLWEITPTSDDVEFTVLEHFSKKHHRFFIRHGSQIEILSNRSSDIALFSLS